MLREERRSVLFVIDQSRGKKQQHASPQETCQPAAKPKNEAEVDSDKTEAVEKLALDEDLETRKMMIMTLRQKAVTSNRIMETRKRMKRRKQIWKMRKMKMKR
nr:uncharacterized protein LOC113822954 [Penaeus vannamei]